MRKRTPPHSMTCRSPVTRFSMDLMQEIGSADVVLEGASFVLRDPDADKITGQVVALRQRMQGLARNVFQGDLTLEFDAVGAVLGHGFHPWKPGKFRSIPNLQSVHRLGCTPITGQIWKPIDTLPKRAPDGGAHVCAPRQVGPNKGVVPIREADISPVEIPQCGSL